MIITRYDYVVHISRNLDPRKMNKLVTQPLKVRINVIFVYPAPHKMIRELLVQ